MDILARRLSVVLLAAVPLAAGASTALIIPVVEPAPVKRAVTVDDMVSLRKIVTLSVSPDGRLKPHLRAALETELAVWVVEPDTRRERLATEAEQAEFKRALERQTAGADSIRNVIEDAVVPPVANANGRLLWLKRIAPRSTIVRQSGRVTTIGVFADDYLLEPHHARGGRLLAIRRTPMAPPTVISIDERSGEVVVLADVNPEFRNIRIARVERIGWDAPVLPWNEPGGELEGTYAKRAGGYIIYPPDFDPSKKYPIFLDPYAVIGFGDSVGHEHPTQVYAAAGIVVLNSAFPVSLDAYARYGPDAQGKLYSAELDFPDMTMKMETTVRGLDAVAARGFIDTTRVGIGGVSNGTFIPLYMLQKHDRITAISISAGSWGPEEYYWPTRRGRERMRGTDWRPKPVDEGREYWRKIDIAEHIDQIEAPIIMHHALAEAHLALRFMRHLADEGKPYDAYIYTNELHLKWQPAHLQSVMQRNLDWFRFWLQDYEDPAPGKQEQYERWRELRVMQCKNPRSLRDYCSKLGGPPLELTQPEVRRR